MQSNAHPALKRYGRLLAFMFFSAQALAQVPDFVAKSDELGIEAVAGTAFLYGHGAAAADYDNDGDIDFYLATTRNVADRLYENQDGRFVDVSAEKGVRINEATRAALWFDYDGDQRLDLLVLGERCLHYSCENSILVWLFRQLPDGTFEDVTETARLGFGSKYDNLNVYAVGGVAAGDLDNDERLDLVITMWGGENTVFMNDGDGTFTDASISSDIGTESDFYFQPMLHDFNHDGWIDIFCNVDFGQNKLWINQQDGTFDEVSLQVGATAYYNEMGMTMGDYDNDGDFDIYCTNITRLHAGVNQHNILLRNDTQGSTLLFTQVAEEQGIHESGWDWGTTFFDVNNDGWLDLATTNGWNETEWYDDASQFWLNQGGEFTDYSAATGFDDSYSATSLLAFDMDRDGDLDLLQTLKELETTRQPVVFYENKQSHTETNRYLVVKPRMNNANHYALGAVVRAEAEGYRNVRLITAGTSFYGQEPAEAFFGVGDKQAVDVTVEWPTGRVSVFPGVATNRAVTLDYAFVSPPANVQIQAVDSTLSASLTWDDRADNEAGYEVQRSETEAFQEWETFSLEADATAFEDTALLADQNYYYRLKAFNDTVHSVYTETVMARVSEVDEDPDPDPDPDPEPPVTHLQDEKALDWRIFPNPSTGRLNLRLQDGFRGEVKVELLDVTGRLVHRAAFRKTEAVLEETLNLSLKPQCYWLKLRIGTHVAFRKVVIL